MSVDEHTIADTRFNKQINVRLDTELANELRRVVRLRRTTLSQLMRDAVVEYLKGKNFD